MFPGQPSAPSLGLVPVEAWLIAGIVYLGLAAAVARMSGRAPIMGGAGMSVSCKPTS
jgi:hypothetical protein